MVAKWIEALTGSLEQKKQYKQSMARIEALPTPYRDSAKAVHRYLLYSGDILDGDLLATMLEDLADIWERAATDGTPIREIVGDDPVEFTESFVRAYNGRHWIDKERARLRTAIDTATAGTAATGPTAAEERER